MKQKEMQIQLTLNKQTNQWLSYKNYIISIKLLTYQEDQINLIKNNLEINFYDNKIFKRILTLKNEEEKFPIEIKENIKEEIYFIKILI